MPIGRTIPVPSISSPVATRSEVIGIVDDVRTARIDEPAAPAIYVPRSQAPRTNVYLVVQPGRVAQIGQAIRSIVHDLDPGQPIELIASFDEILSESIAERRFFATVTTAFSIVGLLLAMVGLYGVTSWSVRERVREIGIRLALGASPARLMNLVLRQGLVPVLWGIVVGSMASWWLSALLRRFLFGVGPTDLATYLGAPAFVLFCSAAACFVPARRALRMKVAEALRGE
jgi:ABC-type antimicrobial peptide transport system permease subunit